MYVPNFMVVSCKPLSRHAHILIRPVVNRDTPTTPQELILGDVDSVKNSNFDPAAPIKLVSHGFGGGSIQEGSSGTLKTGKHSIL